MKIRVGWLLPGLALALAGAWLAWNTFPVLANGGFPMSEPQRFETAGHALVFEDAEERGYDADTWSGGDASTGVRLEARGVDGARLFVGLARADEILGLRRPPNSNIAPCPYRIPRGYLEGVSYELVKGSASRIAGTRRPIRPDRGRFWDVTSTGTTAAVDWETLGGGFEACRILYWYPVVMNPDGSAGVRADVRFGAKILPVAVIASAFAAALLAAAAFFLWKGLARRSSQRVGARPR